MPAFRIVVPVRNAEAWITRCLRSIRSQTVRDFRCIVLDDVSEDRTLERARAAVAGDPRFVVGAAPSRRYALQNIAAGIRAIAHDPTDVIVHVDGDDWLRHRRVLAVLARVYADDGIWVTYGSHQRWKGSLRDRLGLRHKRGIAHPYPPEVLDGGGVRAHPWSASHLRTFRRFLWDAIRPEDLLDEDGGWFRTVSDLVTMFPALEMAGSAHARYLHEMLYVYNTSNPSNDHRMVPDDQQRADRLVRSRPAYPRLASAPVPLARAPRADAPHAGPGLQPA